MSVTLVGQALLSGLMSGCLYALLGLGLTLAWKYLRIINLSHFALIFLAAYLTNELSTKGWHPFLSAVILLPAFFLLGAAQQLLLYRYKVDEFASVIVTFGITIIIEALIQYFWSADFIRMEKRLARGSLEIGPLFAPWDQLAMCAVSIVACVLAWSVLRYSWYGKALRAQLDNPSVAAAFGVPNRRIALAIAGTGSMFAALGGIFIAFLFMLTPSQIYSWFGVILATVLLGGLGNPLGALAAGVVIGVGESLTMALTAPSWAPVVPFSLLIIILVLWPERV